MFRQVGLWLGLLTRCFHSHRSLRLENLALRQQLAVLKRKHPRPRILSTSPTITKTARTVGWARKRRGAEFAAMPRVACYPVIDWVGCITVMIGPPSPKTFPSILNNMCAPCRDVSRREAHG
jgi:hypothetical protein